MVYLGYILPPMNQKLWLEDNKIALRNSKIDNLLNLPFLNKLSKVQNSISTQTENSILTPTSISPISPIISTDIPMNEYEQALFDKRIKQEEKNNEDLIKNIKLNKNLDLYVNQVKNSLQPPNIFDLYDQKLKKEKKKQFISNLELLNTKDLVSPPKGSKTQNIMQIASQPPITSQLQSTAEIIPLHSKDTLEKLTIEQLNDIFIKNPQYNKKNAKTKIGLIKRILDEDKKFGGQYPLSNLFPLNTEGLGLNNNKGVCNTNHEKNFGNYHLADCSFRKGNLLIYKPKTNSTLISHKNMSSKLTKIIQDIKNSKPHSFKIEDYNELNNNEKKVVEHIINILRLDIPAKMERVLADENYKLKSRYEILIGELASGNFGKQLIKELKEVLQKMKTNKVITVTKYNNLIKTLNDF